MGRAALLLALALAGCRTQLPRAAADLGSDTDALPDLCRWPTPFITSVTPPIGPTTGGMTLVLDGGGFVAGAVVTVGDIAAANVVVVSPERVTLTLSPRPGRFGRVTIVLTNRV